ncbi:DUF397 domain-containing protein [Streptomyces sp. NPDC051567]|uniref:DUF397 domain-containing protein n=1 Tax=Streptomyces sp. NPDC051567 TaxID=3365660 RepID=UPI00379B46CB
MRTTGELSNWRKSSYSSAAGDDCVEVCDGIIGAVPVRDSKLTDSPVLTLSPTAWTDFVGMVRADG